MNKKTVTTLLLFLFMASAATAQNKLQFGIKGGINYSNLYVDDVEDESARLGLHVGVATEIPLSYMVSLQPELAYSTKGIEADYNVAGVEGTNTFNINYIDFPVLLKINLLDDIFDIHAGPYASYLLNANISTDGDLGNEEYNLDEDDFNRIDYGLAVGAGVHLGTSIELGLRYNYGLRQVANSSAADLFMGDSKNAVFQVYTIIGL